MWRKYRESIINLIYPARCLACKNIIPPREIVCEGCLAQIEKNPPPFCPRCGRNIKGKGCPSCRKARLYFDRAFSPCRYRDTVSRLIVLFKYKGKTRLLDIFSRIIYDFIRRFRIPIEDMDMAAPIP
ncbi:MAG: ComF family protein, partial [Candidatus Omnitrophota bacterium]